MRCNHHLTARVTRRFRQIVRKLQLFICAQAVLRLIQQVQRVLRHTLAEIKQRVLSVRQLPNITLPQLLPHKSRLCFSPGAVAFLQFIVICQTAHLIDAVPRFRMLPKQLLALRVNIRVHVTNAQHIVKHIVAGNHAALCWKRLGHLRPTALHLSLIHI